MDVETALVKRIGRNPFKPGFGTKPDHLAGRDRELRAIGDALDVIAGPRDGATGILDRPAQPPFKIVGPRGVGKTVLLSEAREMARSRNIAVAEVAGMQKMHAGNKLGFELEEILHREGWSERLLELLSTEEDAQDGAQEAKVKKLMEQCMAKQPLALLMDEVMEYDAEALGALLRICQELIGNRYPLVLLLAGTPHTDGKLDKAGAESSGRINPLYINALAPEATRDALRKPFEKRGVQVKDAALELMAGMTDDYSFFTQIVGLAVWDEMAAAGREKVDEEIVKKAKEEIQLRQEHLHEKIYAHMEDADMLDHVRRITKLLQLNGGRMTKQEVLAELAEDGSAAAQDKAREAFAELVDRNCIWPRDGKMEVGFPSFIRFCQHMASLEENEKI